MFAGPARRHEACTTQPTIWSNGNAAATAPFGSTEVSGSPSTNHHGTPLSIGTMIVWGPTSASADRAAASSAVALTATTSRPAGPSNRVSSAVRALPPSLTSIRSRAPRLVSAITRSPASATLAPTQPPMAPAPRTQMFMDAPMVYKAGEGQGAPNDLPSAVRAAVVGLHLSDWLRAKARSGIDRPGDRDG